MKEKDKTRLTIPVTAVERRIANIQERMKAAQGEFQELGENIQRFQTRKNEVAANMFADERALMELNPLLKTE